MTWVTNDKAAARALKRADRAYAKAREAAKGLVLADKLKAISEARAVKARTYAAVMGDPVVITEVPAPEYARKPGEGPVGIDDLAADIGWSAAYAFHNID